MHICRYCRVHIKTWVCVFVTVETFATTCQYINCITMDMLDVITCPKCFLQYVGCTTSPISISNAEPCCAWQNAATAHHSNVPKHFNRENMEGLWQFFPATSMKGFFQCHGGNLHHTLLNCDLFWITKSRMPLGLNMEYLKLLILLMWLLLLFSTVRHSCLIYMVTIHSEEIFCAVTAITNFLCM